MTANIKHCSQHPKCKGPSLITDHASKCPYGGMGDCDNDQCWEPCTYCVTDMTTPDLDAIEAIAPRRLGDGLNESHEGKIRPIIVVTMHLDDRNALCASIRAKDAEIARLRKALETCGAEFKSRPCVASEVAGILLDELTRRAEIASAALKELP